MNNDKNALWSEIEELVSKAYPDNDIRNSVLAKYRSQLSALAYDAEKIKLLKQFRQQLIDRLNHRSNGTPKRQKSILRLLLLVGGILLIALLVFFGRLFLFQRDNTNANTSRTTTTPAVKSISKLADDDFLIIDSPNEKMKMIPSKGDDSSLAGSENQKVNKMIYWSRHNQAALIGYAKSFGVEIPSDVTWTVDIDGKKYLSEKAREIFYQLEATLLQITWTNTDNIGISGVATGVADDGLNDKFVQDGQIRNYSSWSGMVGRRGNTLYYILDWCGNLVLPKIVPNIPTHDLPIPPEDPKTPPTKDTPPPSSPLKKIEESPQKNQQVIATDSNTVRPGGNDAEDAKVNASTGTSYQGDSVSDVESKQQAEEKIAKENQAEKDSKANTAASAHQQAISDLQRQSNTNNEKISSQTNDGTVDGW